MSKDFRKETFAQGWNAALDFMEMYTTPMSQAKDNLNVLLGTMAGVVLKGQSPDREMLDRLSKLMAGFIDSIDRNESRFREALRTLGIHPPDINFVDIAPAKEFRDAFKRFWDGTDPDGLELKRLAAEVHPIYGECLNDIAPKHYAGKKQNPGNRYIGREGHKLAIELKIALDTEGYLLIGKRLFSRLERGEREADEEQKAFKKLQSCRIWVDHEYIWDTNRLRNAVRNPMNATNLGANISTKPLLP